MCPVAGDGLFANCDLFVDSSKTRREGICRYGGKLLDKDQSIASDSIYIWYNGNKANPLYIDGDPVTAYGPKADDPFDDKQCIAKIMQLPNSNQVCLMPTCDIRKGEEIFVAYGAEYWSDQPHLDSATLQQARAHYYEKPEYIPSNPFNIASQGSQHSTSSLPPHSE